MDFIEQNKNGILIFINEKFVNFLEKLGYRSYEYADGEVGIVYIYRLYDKVWVAQATTPSIIINRVSQLIREEAKNCAAENVFEGFLKHIEKVAKRNIYAALRPVHEVGIPQTRDQEVFVFLNMAVVVDKQGVRAYDINEPLLVWDSQVIGHSISIECDMKESDFYYFLLNITQTAARFDSLYSTIGYLLTMYKDKKTGKIIQFLDENSKQGSNGGTGKSLVLAAIEQLRPVSKLDRFNVKSQFLFQGYREGDTVLAITDAAHNINIRAFYNISTDYMELEQKNKQSRIIKFEEAPKVLIITNYAIDDVDGSTKRRLHSVAFADYYSHRHTPFMDFGRTFFGEDWNQNDWSCFFMLMLKSVELFLNNGLIKAEVADQRLKNLMVNTSQFFLDWVSSMSLNRNTHYPVLDCLASYNEYTNKTDKPVSPYTFVKYMRCLADYTGTEYVSARKRVNNGQISVFMFQDETEQCAQLLEETPVEDE